jgi:formate dehydrogenase major subunit/formate dehydrogenase beta subunit
MVAYAEDIEQGLEEGVIIQNSKVVTRILGQKGHPTGVECLDIRSFTFDEKGELSVDTIPGTEHVLPADTVMFAIGQVPDFGFLEGAGSYRFTKRGTLEVDPNTQATSVKGVFAAGDAVNGPSSVAEAIGSGRRSAISMDCYLMGKPLYEIDSIYLDAQKNITIQKYDSKGKRINSSHIVQYHELLNAGYYEKKPRVAMKRLPPAECIASFEEIAHGYDRKEAVEEAKRCFHCGHCSLCGTCVEVCPLDVLVMGEEGPEVAYPDECWHCGNCRISCPCGAVYYEFPLSMLI